MTPEERDLITTLLDRLRSIVGQPKDPEADRLIGKAVAKIPDAPYYLVQTVLIQDIALHQAETHIAELEEQLAAAEAQQPAPTSFLGGLFGRRQRAQSSGAMPSTGLRDYGPEEQQVSQAGPQYSRSSYGQAGYGRPGDPPGADSPGPTAGGGFLHSAATTAAGLAGGALLAQGISSMFGRGNANSPSGGMRMTPGGAASSSRASASHGDFGSSGYGGGGDYKAGEGDYGGGDEGDEDCGGGDEDGEDYGGDDEGDEDYGGGDEDGEDYGGDDEGDEDYGGGDEDG